MANDEIPPLPEHAAELEAELAFGPRSYGPEEGIRVMEARIKGLMSQAESETDPEAVQRLGRQVADARKRLAQYKLQLDGRN